MTFKVKTLLSTALLLLFVAASAAADFTYQEYIKAPEIWKRGFVFGYPSICPPWRSPTKSLPIR